MLIQITWITKKTILPEANKGTDRTVLPDKEPFNKGTQVAVRGAIIRPNKDLKAIV